MEYTQELDAKGLNCPLPILRTKKALGPMSSGEVLKVLSTDAGSVKDMEAFCGQTGNVLQQVGQQNGTFEFYIKKA